MKLQFNPDILLEIPNLDETLIFMKNFLALDPKPYKNDLYEVKTEKINFYLRKADKFKVIFDFLSENPEKTKQYLLESNECSVYRWNEIGQHISHKSGFSFNLGQNDY